MKKTLTIPLFVFCLAPQVLFSQARDSFFEGVRLYGISGFASWDSFEMDSLSFDAKEYDIEAQAGIFLTDELAVGFDLSYSVAVLESMNSNSEKNTLIVGGFARYYFLLGNSNFAIYPELSVGFTRADLDFEEILDGWSYRAGPGIAYFFLPNVSTELRFLFSQQFLGEVTIHRTNLQLGLQVYVY